MSRAAEPLHAFQAAVVHEARPTQSPAAARAGDPLAFAEATVGGLLGLVSLSPPAKRRLGLRAASRRADGWPAWYLWLAGTDGAYELALLPPTDADAPAPGADFILRYFPHADEAVFADFAPVERHARDSDLFDRTGTPTIETMEALDPSLFHVALLSLRPSAVDGRIDLVLEAQDVWLETSETPSGIETRRAVPGLALAAPVVDFLVCARGYFGRHPPAAFTLARASGLAWHVDAHGDGEPAPTPRAELITLTVTGLPSLGIPDTLSARDDAEAAPDDRHAILCRHVGAATPARLTPFATDDWWKAATWRFYPVGAMCGCLNEDVAVIGPDDDDQEPTRRIHR